MSTSQYDHYKKQTFLLAKTLVIKLEEASQAINQELSIGGYPLVDSELVLQYPHAQSELFHKYYQNLGGIYHISDQIKLQERTGQPFMQIKLATNDGYTWVDFTRDLLEHDPAVANEYQYGSYYYKQLVNDYPEYESLILGILHPVDIDIAYNSKNGEILFCGGYVKSYFIIDDPNGGDPEITTNYQLSSNGLGRGLIETQELNMITELQKWIDKFLFRWTNPAYGLTDDLYVASMLGVMYCQIPMTIMNIRLANCHTSQAHSFHVKQYLESHGRLGHVVDYLPLESTMWLYRNTRYYEANQGKQVTLEAIVDNIFTPADIPLAGYETSHDVTPMPMYTLPKPELIRVPLNFDSVGATRSDKSIESILDDTEYAARLNYTEKPFANKRISDAIRYSGDDSLPTKLLDSEIIPIVDHYPFTLVEILLNNWVYAIEESDTVNKSFSGFVFATNPITGARMILTPKDAYILAMYCLNKGYFNIELERPFNEDFLRARLIYRSSDYTPTEHHPLKPTPIEAWDRTVFNEPKDVMDIYGDFNPTKHYRSTDEFNQVGTSIFLELTRQYDRAARVEDLYARTELELVNNNMFWGEIPCYFDNSKTYPQWLDEKGLDLIGLNEANLITLGLELVESCTGLDLSLTKQTRDRQRAALDVLKHFASYTVQILDSLGGQNGMSTGVKALRTANLDNRLHEFVIAKVDIALEYGMSAHEEIKIIYETFGEEIAFITFNQEEDIYNIEAPEFSISEPKMEYEERVPLPIIGVMNATIEIPEYYSRETAPPPEKRASDKTYYKSDTFFNSDDED